MPIPPVVAGVTRATGETLILTFEAALRVVDKICFTRTAFAAVLKDGTVVTWIHKMTVDTLILCRRR